MKRPQTEPKYLNNGYLLLEYERAVIRKDDMRRYELAEEMARRVFPKDTMMPNIKTVVADFRHWKCNGAQEAYN